MRGWQHLTSLLIVYGGLTGFVASAQSVISAQSGLVHYVEGTVLADDAAVDPKPGHYPTLMEGSVLRTELGRAEILLAPGVFLRAGEHSSLRMVTSLLTDSRLELLGGSVLIECVEMPKDSSVTVVHGNHTFSLLDKGLYRFDTEPLQLRVYDGKVTAESAGNKVTVKKGKLLAFGQEEMVVSKFDRKEYDAFTRWSRRRGEYIALANLSSARSVRLADDPWVSSGWRWNPYFGMFTFVPYRGSFGSYYGYRFFSPRDVYRAYQYQQRSPGGGYNQASYNTGLDSVMSQRRTSRSATRSASPSAGPSNRRATSPRVSVPRQSSGAAGRRR